ncbi:MAG: hypothetical protein HYT49_02210 [Candidatus Wildermuthbacteria bacterium]|nr:hypothetical protein [Candidatus Wildermuthbacteria bacterium]
MGDVILVLALMIVIIPLLLAFDFIGLGAMLIFAVIVFPLLFPINPGPPAHGG